MCMKTQEVRELGLQKTASTVLRLHHLDATCDLVASVVVLYPRTRVKQTNKHKHILTIFMFVAFNSRAMLEI
jgi:hypothetical protein